MQTENKNRKVNILRTMVIAFKGLSSSIKLLIAAALVLLIAGGLFSVKKKFERPPKISPVVTQSVTEIKKIKEFCTAHYYEETVVSASRKKMIGTDDIAIIVKGTVRVGYDLSKMDVNIINDTTISVILPEPKVLDVVTNPSDCETFQESGSWSHKQVTKYKNIARGRILTHAMNDGIMTDAAESAQERLCFIFNALGFKSIEIN